MDKEIAVVEPVETPESQGFPQLEMPPAKTTGEYLKNKAEAAKLPIETKTTDTTEAAPDVPQKTRRQRDNERLDEKIRTAVDEGTATVRGELEAARAELARLKAAPPTPVEQPRLTEPKNDEPTESPIERIMKRAGAPDPETFKAANKTYEQYLDARQDFILTELRKDEQAQARADAQRSDAEKYEQTRAQRAREASQKDTEVMDMYRVIQETGQWPVNAPISKEVGGLRTFSMLRQWEQPTIYHAIAEEIADSTNPTALAKHLSKDGNKELARLANSCKNIVDLKVAVQLMEKDLSTVKVPKTQTTAGEPATVLTSVRATEPTDPEEAALRRKDGTAYARAKKDRQQAELRASGRWK